MAYKKGQGGRIKGVTNKRTRTVEEIAAKYDIDPFEVLMQMAAGDWKALGYDNSVYVKEGAAGSTTIGYTIPIEVRKDAAKAASKYLYAEKKAIELSTGEQGIRIVIEDYTSIKKNGTKDTSSA